MQALMKRPEERSRARYWNDPSWLRYVSDQMTLELPGTTVWPVMSIRRWKSCSVIPKVFAAFRPLIARSTLWHVLTDPTSAEFFDALTDPTTRADLLPNVQWLERMFIEEVSGLIVRLYKRGIVDRAVMRDYRAFCLVVGLAPVLVELEDAEGAKTVIAEFGAATFDFGLDFMTDRVPLPGEWSTPSKRQRTSSR